MVLSLHMLKLKFHRFNYFESLNFPFFQTQFCLQYYLSNLFQSSKLGRAIITDGGIGQRFFRLVVEARETYFFRYKAFIYGY